MTNPNDPAVDNGNAMNLGLTKREYFAAMANAAIIQGLYANPDPKILLYWNPDGVAIQALIHADAQIAAINRTEDKKHGE